MKKFFLEKLDLYKNSIDANIEELNETYWDDNWRKIIECLYQFFEEIFLTFFNIWQVFLQEFWFFIITIIVSFGSIWKIIINLFKNDR